MKITLKDGSVKEYSEAKSIYDIALDISEGLARVACAGELNGEIVDLRTVVEEDASLNIVTANDPAGLQVIRHTAAHVMAQAVQTLCYPGHYLHNSHRSSWRYGIVTEAGFAKGYG